jgi:predicted nucleic-acid-binding protein
VQSQVIGIDTNVLLRFYIEDESDTEAKRQRKAAASLFSGSAVLFVPKSVLLECEWVMRAIYGYASEHVLTVFDHLLELPHVRVEDAEIVDAAIRAYRGGLDFADALHLATCANCDSFATFDDRQFARRAAKMGMLPLCRVPKA